MQFLSLTMKFLEVRDYVLFKSDRETQISYNNVESKKRVQMNLSIKQKLSHRGRKQTYGYQGVRGGEG